MLSIGPLGTNFGEIRIKTKNFSFMKMYLKISFVKWRPFWPGGGDEFNLISNYNNVQTVCIYLGVYRIIFISTHDNIKCIPECPGIGYNELSLKLIPGSPKKDITYDLQLNFLNGRHNPCNTKLHMLWSNTIKFDYSWTLYRLCN